MDLVKLTEYLIKNLVKDTDNVSVTMSDGNEKIIDDHTRG